MIERLARNRVFNVVIGAIGIAWAAAILFIVFYELVAKVGGLIALAR